ncbi:NDR1/HIN1-like protein 12 [Rutidosis leptorrhynchoides]|uniref:NDR1/HIN1-like protein 12 n=1 Tax=Rutidosis leptorrhynchoides TaxID=125765 RepID=UPI003A99804D
MGNGEKHTADEPPSDHHNHKTTPPYTTNTTHRKVSTIIVIILLILFITALILWLLYHPHKPTFTVVGATVYGVNTSSPPSITAMQIALVTRNPNNRVSIYYDHISVFVSYNNQPVTPILMLPPLHHKKDTTVLVSPVWPVLPEVVNGLGSDGAPVSLRLVLTGKLRWKYGDVKSGRNKVYVGCDVLVGLKIV